MSHLNVLDAAQAGQWERAIKYILLLILPRRPAEEHQELIRLVSQYTPKLEVETMAKSMADVLREQGIEQGETRAKQAAVLKLLQFRFVDVPESVSHRVTRIQNISRLDSLFEAVWQAPTLDEIDWQNHNN